MHWGGLIATLYPLSVGYAILRYQLFDIRVVVRKGLVYSLLTATLPALLIAILFQPARNRIQTFVDRAFFRRGVEVRQALTAFSRDLSTLRDKGEVVRLVVDTVTEILGAKGARLWLLDWVVSL